MSNTNSPGQGSLFATERLNTIVADGKEIPASYGPPGSYMDIAARAHYLIVALDSISQRNMREGLSVAAETPPYNSEIWGHYTHETETVLKGADRNRLAFHKDLRHSFWAATGFTALRASGVLKVRGSGLMSERQIKPRAKKMWRDFNNDFSHPSKTKQRNKYKKQLSKNLEQAVSLKENVAA